MKRGLTRADIMKLAYEMAVKKSLKILENWRVNQQASIDWLKSFKKRPSLLSLLKSISLGRATSFKKTTVNEFFTNLKKAYDKLSTKESLEPSQIRNLDETALTTVYGLLNEVIVKLVKSKV